MRRLALHFLLALGTCRADDFIKGADVSWLPQMEASAWVFRDDSGKPADCLKILFDHGMNTVRLRVWVNPSEHPRSGHCSPEETADLAARAKRMGFRILLDFHYSDTWADPSHQPKPAAWADHDVEQLGKDVFNHTTDVLKAMRAKGVTPEWVQVGNEIANGMLWPEGKLPANFEALAGFIRQGGKAVKEFDPSIKVILHLHGGENQTTFRWFFDAITERKVNYDIIGLSYYPAWTKDPRNYQTTIEDLGRNLDDMATRYHKPVMIVETGGPDDKPAETRAMLEAVIRKVRAVPEKQGLGVLYWEPEGAAAWSHYKMSCWNADGRPTEALDAFLEKPEPDQNRSLTPSAARALVTRIDDGDRKTTRFESDGKWNYNEHQDDEFQLFRSTDIRWSIDSQNADVTLRIARDKTYQTISGFGAALTDSSAFVLSKLKSGNPTLYAFTMNRLFSRENGAGFSVLRLSIGASDYVATPGYYSCCDERSPDLGTFTIARDKEFVIPILKDALRINPNLRLIATPWSAPAWMKTNGRLTGLSHPEKSRGATNRLRDDSFDAYADYLVRFISSYQNEGIRIDSITLQNEPQNDLSNYPCMRMTADDQIRLVNLLGPRLAARSLKTRILVHDHNWILHPNDRTPVGGDVKQAPQDEVTRMLSDPDASRFIAGSAWHIYAGGPGDMTRVYDALHTRFPEKEILTTEHSAWGLTRGPWWGDIDWGLRHNWMAPLEHWSTTSLQWNLALDRKGGPSPRNDSKAVGLVTIDNGGVRFEREFYPMAQLSIAAPPGAKRVAASVSRGDSKGIESIAFLQPDGKASLVLVNRNREERAVRVDDGNHGLIYQLPGRSIATIVW